MEDRTLGPYRILGDLGRGGMGSVYLAEAVRSVRGVAAGERVALKVIHPHLLAEPGFLRRFRREARIGLEIRHENVVRVLDTGEGTWDGEEAHYLVMEYVEGRTLREVLRDLKRFPEALLREVARQVSAGLAAIHAGGVVHRDVKPENVLITDDQQVRIMDLGVARFQEPRSNITEAGLFAGSLLYAAPEQFRNEPTQDAADLYSLGVMLYELATGGNPFRRDVAASVIQAHLSIVPPLASETCPDLSPFFCDVIAMLLSKQADARFPSAAELCDVLQRGERSTWWTEREARVLEARHKVPHIAVSRDTRLIGRETELAALREAWQEARLGRGRTVLLQGEAGIGKTRLVDAFVVDPGGEAQVLYGAYSPSGGLGGLSEAILDHFGSRDLEKALAPLLEATPNLVPSFAALVRQEGPPPGSEPLRPEALHAVMVNLMRGMAERMPLIWVVDDLLFAEPESRRVVLSLARAVKRHAVLLVVCMRPGLPEEELAHFRHLETTSQIELGRLSPRQVIEVLRESFRSESLAEKLGGKIAYKSDGVPFFVFEMVRGLQEGRFIEAGEDGTFHETRVVDAIEVPSAVRDLLLGRLQELKEEERELLDAASVQGLEIDGDLLARVCGRKRIEVLQRLAWVERRTQLVRARGARWHFDHHQLREVVYEALPESLRREYHALLAEAFATREGLGEDAATVSDEQAVFLATHRLRGSEPAAARPFLQAALEHLAGSYRNEGAVELGREALAVPGLLAGMERLDVLLAVANGLNTLGARDEERAVLEEAEALAAAGADARRRCLVRQALGRLHFASSAFDAAQAAFEEALRLAEEAGDGRLRGRATGALGNVCARLGRYEEARSHYERCAAIALAVGDRDAEAAAAGNLGNVSWFLGRREDARRGYERQLAISREIGALHGEALALGNLGLLLAHDGDLDGALVQTEQALEIHRRTGDRRGEAWARHSLADALADQGRLREGLAQGERSLELAREIEDRRAEANAAGSLGMQRMHLGRHEEARRLFERQRRLATATHDRRGAASAAHNLAELTAYGGALDDALRLLHDVLAEERALANRQGIVTTLYALASLHARRGERDEARARLLEVLERTSEHESRHWRVLAHLRLALLEPERIESARADLLRNASRLGFFDLLTAHWLLWEATHDPVHLEEAHRRVQELCRNAPEEDWEAILERDPLCRDVTRAWRAREDPASE